MRKLLGVVMLILGFITLVCFGLAMTGIVFTASDMSSSSSWVLAIFFTIVFGVPGGLLLYFGNRFVKKTPSKNKPDSSMAQAAPASASTRNEQAKSKPPAAAEQPQPAPQPQAEQQPAYSVACASCGAPTTLLMTERKPCEYCGTLLYFPSKR